MGEPVDRVVLRARERHGEYQAWDWERFIQDAGIDVYFCRLPIEVPAFLHDDCIYIQKGIRGWPIARYVWHEIGHALMHAGGRFWWESRPQGHITVAKFERQANEFARLFPVWDD